MTHPEIPFPEDLDAFTSDTDLSDAELDALMAGALPGTQDESSAEVVQPGERVHGTVITVRDNEVLVELDHKSHGVIDAREFRDEELPVPGSSLDALVQHFDDKRELVVLSVSETRREVFWDELTTGTVFEGVVSQINKGGLTLDIKGARAFLPVSQIERQRVEDLKPYLGRKLTVEVISFDRAAEDLVVSRRNILDREADVLRQEAITHCTVGQVVQGTVTRINEHGAFIDVGGVDGLLHRSKILQHQRELGSESTLRAGQTLHVEIVHVDPDRLRIGLDFHHAASDDWDRAIGDYEVGQQITGLVTRVTADAACVLVEEGVEGTIPDAGSMTRGSVVRVEIVAIHRQRREVILRAL